VIIARCEFSQSTVGDKSRLHSLTKVSESEYFCPNLIRKLHLSNVEYVDTRTQRLCGPRRWEF
jgi:hypothetical protein